jgi:hypothetical protein
MPIGTSKAGLFGGKPTVLSGCETFNAPGTFTAPDGLEIVSATGVGGAGSAGNSGNSGDRGQGGSGGSGGNAGSGLGGPGGVPPTSANGNLGNIGATGAASSVFCLCFPGGAGGNGGTGGNVGNAGMRLRVIQFRVLLIIKAVVEVAALHKIMLLPRAALLGALTYQ